MFLQMFFSCAKFFLMPFQSRISTGFNTTFLSFGIFESISSSWIVETTVFF